MLKHNKFNRRLVGLRLLTNGGMGAFSNLNNSVSRPLCPTLRRMTPIVRSLNIDLENLCLRCLYMHLGSLYSNETITVGVGVFSALTKVLQAGQSLCKPLVIKV